MIADAADTERLCSVCLQLMSDAMKACGYTRHELDAQSTMQSSNITWHIKATIQNSSQLQHVTAHAGVVAKSGAIWVARGRHRKAVKLHYSTPVALFVPRVYDAFVAILLVLDDSAYAEEKDQAIE